MFELKREGITTKEQAVHRDRLALEELGITAATTLSDLTKDYVLYTPALLYLRVDLRDRDPFHAFLAEYQQALRPIVIELPKPLFAGLTVRDDDSWNHTVFAMEKEHWPAYQAFVGSLAFVDYDAWLLSRVRYKEHTVPDILTKLGAQQDPATRPLVTITTLCLDTNKGCWYFEPNRLGILESQRSPETFPETVVFAKALFKQNPNPYKRVDQLIATPTQSPEEVELERRYAENLEKHRRESSSTPPKT